jgi:tRNA-dihydrouridine synthase A
MFEHPISVAPMMERTDRHFRYLMRLISRRTLLYTEMVTMHAIIYGDKHQHLDFNEEEHPVSLQLGGDDPEVLARCAAIAQQWGYDEINLNVGCPSPRVQRGNFGACLMTQPDLVARCLDAMRAACDLPVTVKHRIGVDDHDSYDHMRAFVDTVAAESGCTRFSVHARKAWLNGLSPKDNRTIPPLRYDEVYRLKQERPDLTIEINGGVKTIQEVHAHLAHVDAVMIGRAAYDDPFLFASVDHALYGEPERALTRAQVVEAMIAYIDRHIARGGRHHHVTRHMLSLYAGCPGGRAWRRHIAEHHAKWDGAALLQLARDLDSKFDEVCSA